MAKKPRPAGVGYVDFNLRAAPHNLPKPPAKNRPGDALDGGACRLLILGMIRDAMFNAGMACDYDLAWLLSDEPAWLLDAAGLGMYPVDALRERARNAYHLAKTKGRRCHCLYHLDSGDSAQLFLPLVQPVQAEAAG